MHSRAYNQISNPEDAASGTMPVLPRLVDYSATRFRALCSAAGFAHETESTVNVFRRLVSVCGDIRVAGNTEWVSDISDDNTPIEFSVAIADGKAEVRVLFEPAGEEPTLSAYRAAGLAFNQRIEREFGAELRRFRAVQDLFLPEEMQGPFALWSSAVFREGHPPSFKAYFSPIARGVEHAHSLVEEGLRRLGLGDAWRGLQEHVLRRGSTLDELKYFALDLTNEDQARVKVYVRHHAASPDELEFASSLARSYVPGETRDFVCAMSGGQERLNARAAFTCSSLSDSGDRPAATTVYVPVCAYARDDERVRDRVWSYVVNQGGDPTLYDQILKCFANRPLTDGVGMQPWVALRRHHGQMRLTVYLATEARRVYAPGEIPAPTTDYSTLTPPPIE